MDRNWLTSQHGPNWMASERHDTKSGAPSPYDGGMDAGSSIRDDPFDPGRYWDFFTGTD